MSHDARPTGRYGVVELLSDITNPDGADPTFKRVLRRIKEAQRSITLHMFVWRNDTIGNEVGRTLLEAADRGVAIHIKKDLGAMMYERIEMNRKPFLNRDLSVRKRLTYALIATTFPDTFVQDEYTPELGNQMLAHPRITVEWVNHTHTKYYLFDDRILILGSINLEDRHRTYRDYMVEISGEDPIRRFHARRNGEGAVDPQRSLDFVVNDLSRGAKRLEIKETILQRLLDARESVYIEMAYLGDPDINRAIIQTSRRGVSVTMLVSREANIGNDLNYRTVYRLYIGGRLTVYLSEKMLHSKLMMFDDETVVMGSANLSVFSMTQAGEVDIVVRRDPAFLSDVTETIQHRLGESRKVDSIAELASYNKVLAMGQQLHQMLG